MIIDTTVWIHLFRKEEKAREFLLGLKDDIAVSRITVMEIIYGRSSKKDITTMWKQFEGLGVRVEEIDEDISARAGRIFETYFPTRGIGLLDTFVAATAIERDMPVVTHNKRHFDFIEGLELIVPY